MTNAVPLDAIASTVARWHAARDGAAKLHATAAQAERDILAALGDADVGTIAGHPVVRREVEERHGCAFAALRTEYPDLAERFATRWERITLKVPNDRKAVDA